jgi:tetratricopeptide (TPR) repeat protein
VAEIQGSQLDPNRGDPKGAMQSYAKSNALLEPLLAQNPGNAHLGAILGESYMRQSRTLLYTQGPKEAITAAETAVRYLEPSRAGFATQALYVGILGDAYAVQAQCLALIDRHREAMEPLEKLVRISEEFTRAHPDDIKGLQALAKAYINSAITDNPEENEVQKLARVEPLYVKAMDIQQRLATSDPADSSYRWNLGETQYNFGDLLYDNRQYDKALDLFRKASAAFAGLDSNDARAVMVNAMNDVNLAKALVVKRSFAEAERVIARVDPVLRKLNQEGTTIQIEWALAQVGIARGQMLIAFADNPRASSGERSALLLESRKSLREAITFIESVNKAITLFGIYKKTWDEALASLAQAEAGLTRL